MVITRQPAPRLSVKRNLFIFFSFWVIQVIIHEKEGQLFKYTSSPLSHIHIWILEQRRKWVLCWGSVYTEGVNSFSLTNQKWDTICQGDHLYSAVNKFRASHCLLKAESVQSIPAWTNACQSCWGLIYYFCRQDISLLFEWIILSDVL